MSVQQAELPEILQWRQKLGSLYEDIRGWVSEMSPSPTVEEHPILLNEKKSGEYEVMQLLIKRGDRQFWVRPIAKWVVGADGRVDLVGGEGPFVLIWMLGKGLVARKDGRLIEAENLDGWYFRQDRPPWGSMSLTGADFRGLAELCLL